jgi:hypothetical protein
MVIAEILKRVRSEMVGRMADPLSDNTQIMLEALRDGGDGNYLEIGVLFGGSLVSAALLKKELGQKGQCYGVDPLTGNYAERCPWRGNIDPVSKLEVTPGQVYENIKRFDVEDICAVIQSNSYPFPIQGTMFAVAYIDGDHWGDAPLKDWLSVKGITDKFVVFDNCDKEHPDVIEACSFAEGDPEWERYRVEGMTFVIKRKDEV